MRCGLPGFPMETSPFGRLALRVRDGWRGPLRVGAGRLHTTLDRALQTLVRTCGVALPDALAMAPLVPAESLGLRLPYKISCTQG
jgi:N-acetylglucosamine-6-phosphate deacetylase